ETYLRQLLEAHARAPEVVVAWQGGEPTMMGLDFFRRSIELERRYARPGQRVLNTIQTNGTLLTDEWGEFLKANEFLVGISIAGWGSSVVGSPLFVLEATLVTHRSVGPAQYGRFLIDVFEEWVRRDIGTVYVQMFDTALANWFGEDGGMCVHAKTCGSQLA